MSKASLNQPTFSLQKFTPILKKRLKEELLTRKNHDDVLFNDERMLIVFDLGVTFKTFSSFQIRNFVSLAFIQKLHAFLNASKRVNFCFNLAFETITLSVEDNGRGKIQLSFEVDFDTDEFLKEKMKKIMDYFLGDSDISSSYFIPSNQKNSAKVFYIDCNFFQGKRASFN